MRTTSNLQKAVGVWLQSNHKNNKSAASQELGVSRLTLGSLLNGTSRPHSVTVRRIAEVTGVPFENIWEETVTLKLAKNEAAALLRVASVLPRHSATGDWGPDHEAGLAGATAKLSTALSKGRQEGPAPASPSE